MELRDAREMSFLELVEVIEDRLNCGNCINCKANYIRNNDTVEKLSCNEAVNFVVSLMREKAVTLEKNTHEDFKPSTEDSSFYQSTRSFMKRRGYKHCYMCGSEL